MLTTLWTRMGQRARWTLLVGVVLVLVLTTAIGVWAFRVRYEVLFSGLAPQDAAAMTQELTRQKLPYQVGDDGESILVDSRSVHELRLKLMGSNLPLQGAVGFELFNNADIGMTEFAQKVNYQRALQGELTRTIQSLNEIESARVHLALSEQGLFKRDQAKAKAAVTLSLKRGMSLRPDQVAGIQRLVAAAVTGIQADDVTIVDDHGVALTATGSETAVAVSQRITLKQEIERQLARKANDVLEKAFGPGQALASVDVALDMDQVKVSTEDVLTPPVAAGEAPLGVVLREKETSRDTGLAQTMPDGEVAVPATMHRETEYQLGRKVAQTVSTPGAITRLNAVAVLSAPLSDEQIEQVKKLVAGAVGASADRGDAVVVQSITRLVPANAAPAADAVPVAARRSGPGHSGDSAVGSDRTSQPLAVIAVLAAMALIGGVMVTVRRWRVSAAQQAEAARVQPQISREQQLLRIQAWLGEPANTSARTES